MSAPALGWCGVADLGCADNVKQVDAREIVITAKPDEREVARPTTL